MAKSKKCQAQSLCNKGICTMYANVCTKLGVIPPWNAKCRRSVAWWWQRVYEIQEYTRL